MIRLPLPQECSCFQFLQPSQMERREVNQPENPQQYPEPVAGPVDPPPITFNSKENLIHLITPLVNPNKDMALQEKFQKADQKTLETIYEMLIKIEEQKPKNTSEALNVDVISDLLTILNRVLCKSDAARPQIRGTQEPPPEGSVALMVGGRVGANETIAGPCANHMQALGWKVVSASKNADEKDGDIRINLSSQGNDSTELQETARILLDKFQKTEKYQRYLYAKNQGSYEKPPLFRMVISMGAHDDVNPKRNADNFLFTQALYEVMCEDKYKHLIETVEITALSSVCISPFQKEIPYPSYAVSKAIGDLYALLIDLHKKQGEDNFKMKREVQKAINIGWKIAQDEGVITINNKLPFHELDDRSDKLSDLKKFMEIVLNLKDSNPDFHSSEAQSTATPSLHATRYAATKMTFDKLKRKWTEGLLDGILSSTLLSGQRLADPPLDDVLSCKRALEQHGIKMTMDELVHIMDKNELKPADMKKFRIELNISLINNQGSDVAKKFFIRALTDLRK